MNKLSKALFRYRAENNLTRAAAAKRLGVNPRTWEGWEQGRREPQGLAGVMIRRLIGKAE